MCIARRLRVWRLLPPRIGAGACSSTSTEAPASRAVMAAVSAALPPPTTTMSQTFVASMGATIGSGSTDDHSVLA